MPFGMGGYVQSVLVEGTVYVGGGVTGYDDNDYIVMAYVISSEQWTKLPPYRTCYDFALTVISNQLVLVGGEERGGVQEQGVGCVES